MFGIAKKEKHLMKIELIKKPCAFVLQIKHPLETLRRLAMSLDENGIIVEKMQLHRYRSGDASLIMHCHIERQRIANIITLLKELSGVIELEQMEAK